MPPRPPASDPSPRVALRRVGNRRTGIYLTVGAALVGPTAAAGLAGCGPENDAPAAEQTVALTGVETVIQQQPDGSYQIADERVTEGSPGRVTIIHLDSTAAGGTRTEVLDSPEAFAARLPATPPDSLGGAGQSWGEGANGQQASENRPAYIGGGGFGLGQVLLMSAMFNLWRPPYYAGYNYGAPARGFATDAARQRSLGAVRPALQSAAARGTLATAPRVAAARAAATRASRPTGGRSGAFGRSATPRSSGG